jgi:hypothetical protein
VAFCFPPTRRKAKSHSYRVYSINAFIAFAKEPFPLPSSQRQGKNLLTLRSLRLCGEKIIFD